MARSTEATKRRAEKRKRTVPDQRKVDNRDAAKREDREQSNRIQKGERQETGESSKAQLKSVVGLDAIRNAYKLAKKEYKQSEDKNKSIQSQVELKRVKSNAKKALKEAEAAGGGLQHYQQISTGLLDGVRGDDNTSTPTPTVTKPANAATATATATATGEEEQIIVNGEKRKDNKNRLVDPYRAILAEPGSWVCASCTNHNFASRAVCNSKTCNNKRPAHVIVPPRFQHPSKKSRHDPATSKKMKWGAQASAETVDKNQDLRKRYVETGGEGMEEADVARAKLLLERDERKKRKKLLKKKGRRG